MFLVFISLVLFVTGTASADTNCPGPATQPGDRRVSKTKLRIATYNVEWLFLTKWEKRWPSLEGAEKHLKDIAAVIAALDADIIHLAEVEDCIVLRRLVAAIGDDTLRYYMIGGTDTSTGQNTALLTRVDPVAALWRTSHRVEYPLPGCTCKAATNGTYGVSKHYFATVKPESFPPLLIAGVHFLAMPDDVRRCPLREAQAAVIASIVKNETASDPSLEAIVLGDYNDWDPVVPDIARSTPITRTVNILRNYDAATAEDELSAVAARAATSTRYTAYWDPTPGSCKPPALASSSLDHALVSAGISAKIRNVTFSHTYPPECRGGEDRYYSDHWPIVIDLAV